MMLIAIMNIGWTKVTCHVKDIAAVDVAISRASENLTRVDMTPIEEGTTYKDLHENFKLSIEAIADKMGKSPGVVKRRIDLLSMCQELQDAIHHGKITYGVAESLNSIVDRTALSYYLSCAIDNGITVDVARQWARDWKDSLLREGLEVGQGNQIPSVYVNKPVYVACDICSQAMEINSSHMFRACPKCVDTIRTIHQS